MKLSDFDFELPKEFIAQEPVKPRDHSRLLIVCRTRTNTDGTRTGAETNPPTPFSKGGKIEHKHFYNIVDYLRKGDVLVLNNSKVFPARLIGKKKETGGQIEIFLLKLIVTNFKANKNELGARRKNENWECLVKGGKIGMEVKFKKNLEAKIINKKDETYEVEFNMSGKKIMDVVNRIGEMPLPPYIKSKVESRKSKVNYQTVYADEKKTGSVAAPTAGFHFTPGLIKKLKKKGVIFEYVTLHVGLGTFAPVKIDNIKKHKMHSEWVEVKKKTIENIIKAKSENRRVVCVGTTSVRTLESVFGNCKFKRGKLIPLTPFLKGGNFSGWTDIFIYPGYKFKVVDAMITNFHLPKSTLLMLVSAFAGKKNIDKAYREAVRKNYRFFSYGDAMFLH